MVGASAHTLLQTLGSMVRWRRKPSARKSPPTSVTDGASEMRSEGMPSRLRPHRGANVCTIFVHAGAGYHSRDNQNKHLEACSDAASVAMALLRAGASSLDAVEMAVKLLEDREITNAGYGSNLAFDGTVECDATIMDEHGRSGAVGAVCHIRNPISLARVVLARACQPLSLRRIPPNLLVGNGATDFAFEQGIPILPHDALVSLASRQRWMRWKEDLKTAAPSESPENAWSSNAYMEAEAGPDAVLDAEELERRRLRMRHTMAMEGRGVTAINSLALKSWKTVNTHSPAPSLALSTSDFPKMLTPAATPRRDIDMISDWLPSNASQLEVHESTLGELDSSLSAEPQHLPIFLRKAEIDQEFSARESGHEVEEQVLGPARRHSSKLDVDSTTGYHGKDKTESEPYNSPPGSRSATQASSARSVPEFCSTLERTGDEHPTFDDDTSSAHRPSRHHKHDDLISDTVGAIAIDCFGRIAAASSSGGIGMKHPGRVGPAALVGIGTAVIPEDPDDEEKASVAVVTSGTGEHIATTMAATRCADRIYRPVKFSASGKMEAVTEDMALRYMIEKDFMGHPSVINSPSTGALGVLAVKKTVDGVQLYFAHNTDSFAVASMQSDEEAPICTMSRNKGNGGIAQGARWIKYHRHR